MLRMSFCRLQKEKIPLRFSVEMAPEAIDGAIGTINNIFIIAFKRVKSEYSRR